MKHKISYLKDEQGVKEARCICGWSFRGWRIPLDKDSIAAYFMRATGREFIDEVQKHLKAKP